MISQMDLPRTNSAILQGVPLLHPGAQLYVSMKGRVIANVAVGDALQGVKMTPDSVICWSSSGSPTIAVAIAKLWQQGELLLVTTLSRSSFRICGQRKGCITIRHCLTHTAGLRAATSAWARASYGEIIEQICRANLEPGWTIGKSADITSRRRGTCSAKSSRISGCLPISIATRSSFQPA